MPIADVLLADERVLDYDFSLRESEPPLSKQLEVAAGISLAGVRTEIAQPVMRATAFRGGKRLYPNAIYGFIRYDPPGTEWDSDNQIGRLVFLSHFVRANEMGFEYAARVETDDAGKLVSVDPAPTAPPFARAYGTHGAKRRWLTQAEGEVLRDLFAAYERVLPSLEGTRVGVAISAYHESPFIYSGRPRGLLLATILEGLVSTMPQRAVKQFVTRVPVLAAKVGLSRLDKKWAEDAYVLRSKLAHGGSLIGTGNELERETRLAGYNEKLTELDELLRRVLRGAILDADFRDLLEGIDTHIPVAPYGCPACQARDSSATPVSCPSCSNRWT